MRALIDAIEGGAFGDIDSILHIGIGGSALGPDLLLDALGRDSDRYQVSVLSNIDGQAFDEAPEVLDPATTLVVARRRPSPPARRWPTSTRRSNGSARPGSRIPMGGSSR